MKTLHKLTGIYLAGFVLLTVVTFLLLFSLDRLHIDIMADYGLAEQMAAGKEAFSGAHEKLLQTANAIQAIQTRGYTLFGITLLAFLAGAVYFSYIYRKDIVKPLHRITATTRQIKEGQLENFPLIKSAEMRMLAENLFSIDRILNDKNEELETTFYREKNALRTLGLLTDLNNILLSKAKVHEFLELILSSSLNIIRSELGAIALLDRNTGEVTHFISTPTEYADDAKVLAEELIARFVDSKKPVRLRAASKSRLLKGKTKNLSIKVNNILAVPITLKKDLLGGIIFINRAGSSGFTMENKNQAAFISCQAAMAIEKSLLHEAMLKSAKTDELTGLDNHISFLEKAQVELKRSERFERPMSMLVIDIDFFKRFNDTYGQQSGDTAIREIGNIFKAKLRKIDLPARYDSAAFIVLLPETPLAGALITAERIKRAVGTHSFTIKGNVTYLTVSIGVSVFPYDAGSREAMITAASDALQAAKRSGRNKVVPFSRHKEKQDHAAQDRPDAENA